LLLTLLLMLEEDEEEERRKASMSCSEVNTGGREGEEEVPGLRGEGAELAPAL